MDRRIRSWGVVAVAVAAVAFALWLTFERAGRVWFSAPAQVASAPAPAREAELPSGDAPGAAPRHPAPPPAPLPAEDIGDDDLPDLAGEEAFGSWESVDLEAVRAAMPDNLYWKMSAPTRDERVVEERAAERARWNVEYGKILSGTASEEEIRAYYDRRARLSGDYVEFVTYLLDHYETALPERDVGLLMLARRLHRARLEEIPRRIEEAFERKRQQDAARETWRKDREVFGDFAAGENGAE